MRNSEDGPGIVYRFVFFFWELIANFLDMLSRLLEKIAMSDKL